MSLNIPSTANGQQPAPPMSSWADKYRGVGFHQHPSSLF
jgi:hypothetical protein